MDLILFPEGPRRALNPTLSFSPHIVWLQYSNWIICKIKWGKGKEAYIEAGGL